MHTALRLSIAAVTLLALASLVTAASASISHPAPATVPAPAEAAAAPAASGAEVEPVAIWSFIVVLLTAAAGGVFYLLKKRMGGFPAHPAWIAPIEIMRSSTFPDETTYGDAPADPGHGGHH